MIGTICETVHTEKSIVSPSAVNRIIYITCQRRPDKIKLKGVHFTLEQTRKAQTGSRGVALLSLQPRR
jgi:hypothetical protein